MQIFQGISLITSFFGGMVALFAPCCITFLLPNYLANIFRSKANVLAMTALFGFGIATVLVPTALGIRAVGSFFETYHTQTYVAGGIFMIILGAMELSGKKITLPMLHLTIDLNTHKSPWAVYILGIFSGITTSCCTPVLAGVLTLSFLSPTFLWAGLAGIAYVTGMVIPLVVLAIFLEKIHWDKLPLIKNKTIFIGEKRILVTDITAGILYIVTGIVISVLSLTGRIAMGDRHSIEDTLGTGMMNLVRSIKSLPGSEFIFAGFIVLIIIYLYKKRRPI